MTFYKKGAWNAICDSCGFKYKSTALRERWDKFMVCNSCFETRHPMDFFKAKSEDLRLPWTRQEPTDSFLPVNSYTPYVNWVNIFDEGLPDWEYTMDGS